MIDAGGEEINRYQTPTEASDNFNRLWTKATIGSIFWASCGGGNLVLVATKLAEGKPEEALAHGLFAGTNLWLAGNHAAAVRRAALRLTHRVPPFLKK